MLQVKGCANVFTSKHTGGCAGACSATTMPGLFSKCYVMPMAEMDTCTFLVCNTARHLMAVCRCTFYCACCNHVCCTSCLQRPSLELFSESVSRSGRSPSGNNSPPLAVLAGEALPIGPLSEKTQMLQIMTCLMCRFSKTLARGAIQCRRAFAIDLQISAA